MASPGMNVMIAFGSDPNAAIPLWNVVNSYVKEFTITRGRKHERDQFVAGKCSVILDNSDRRFDPKNTAGPYYPNVLPMKRILIEGVWGDPPQPGLFLGYIEGWNFSYPRGASVGWAEVVGIDGFKPMSLYRLSNFTRSAERSDLRIAAILDAMGWPSNLRSLGTGQSTAAAVTLNDESALIYIQKLARGENAFLFMDKDGKMTFKDRHTRIRQPITTYVTLGDGGGSEELYANAAFDFDDVHLWNDVRITREGGVQQRAQDATSQQKYGIRVLEESGFLMNSDNEARAMAENLLFRYKDPALRIPLLKLDPDVNPNVLWTHAMRREIGDRIIVRKRPPGGGSFIEQTSTIEGIYLRWQSEGHKWTVQWDVSPADTQTYWQLGDTTYGVLGSTTRLAY